jgi:glycosyltransferase involved in cell wall biosynthesis
MASGYGKQSQLIVERLANDGHEVKFFAFTGLQGNVLQLPYCEVLPSGFELFGNDVVEAHYAAFGPDLFITLCDAWVLHNYGRFNNWFPMVPVDSDPVAYEVLEAIKGASGIISITQFGQRQLNAQRVPSLYIPHGIDTNIYKPVYDTPEEDKFYARMEYNLSPDTTVFLQVGDNRTRPVSRKAFDKTMEAFRKFLTRHPNSVLILHTDPQVRRGGIDLVRLRNIYGLERHVLFPEDYKYFLGYKELDMASLYRLSDCLLSPSIGEGFGLPVIEAQAVGRPVIATSFAGDGEHIGSGWPIQIADWYINGHYVRQALVSATHLYECMEEFMRSDWDELAFQSRENALQFDIDLVYNEYWRPFIASLGERDLVKVLEGMLS